MINVHDIMDVFKPKKVSYLKDSEVHVWYAYFPENIKNISHFANLLSKDEWQRAESYRFSRDQQYFIISRGILKYLLAYYLKDIPKNIEIMYGLWGKPCVLTAQPLYFNLSHSRDYILYAISRNFEIGVDIEYIDSTINLENIALNVLSSQELAYWKNIKPEDKVNTFFKFWVSKESFLKALGKGWLDTEPIPSLEKKFLDEVSIDYKSNKKMTFPYCFEIISEYASSLFVNGPFLRPIYYKWDPINL